jgi:hypothetical protein
LCKIPAFSALHKNDGEFPVERQRVFSGMRGCPDANPLTKVRAVKQVAQSAAGLNCGFVQGTKKRQGTILGVFA